ncbi:4Fe-4S binding protein [Eggerthellaceae bacterium zg-1084]|uniref:4Fe-4S binding protein n=1 Tax=Berryella wangjianweii TaxID=2734634 RepID=A0A6M8J256_9ACTN|nr:4Fe-4S dicluster domain-containing protein [Berryella wangjianweii]NPD30888.1 4Fe-4S binding protein [Berryella wangjianweii]NPD31753.1 4Fe-4S binding protein [Eggerthellaceae bacterium zg-997]QKF07647.1 4Fe-4S binding protein [Berryella wangjianweii]
MTQYGFYFDGTRCTGCKTCEMACKDYKDLPMGFAFRKVYEVEYGATTRDAEGIVSTTCANYSLSLSCNHCDQPACVEVCPTGAMHKDPDTGLVTVSQQRCVGCGYCHMACPYNVPKVDRGRGFSTKCDGCAERLTQGDLPVCVGACPARALSFGPVDQMQKMGARASVSPLPVDSLTAPNLYVHASDDFLPAEHPEGKVANPLEVK